MIERRAKDSLTGWAIAVVLITVLYLAYQGWLPVEGGVKTIPIHAERIRVLETRVEVVDRKVDLLLEVAVKQGLVSKAAVEETKKDATPDRGGEPLQR